MQVDNIKRGGPLRPRRLVALRAGIVGVIDFVCERSSLLLRVLTVSVLLGTTTTLSAQEERIVVAPPRINPNHQTDLVVTSPVGLDLSTVERVEITPNDNISVLATKFLDNELTISLSIDADAQISERTLKLFGPGIRLLASHSLSVVTVGGDCPDEENCCSKDPTNHLCTQCSFISCQHPSPCPDGQHCCDDVVHSSFCNKCVPISQSCHPF